MSNSLIGFCVVSGIVTIDNALLTGMIIPPVPNGQRHRIILVVALILCFAQIGLSIGVESLLDISLFRHLAILILIWMSIRTLSAANKAERLFSSTSIIAKTAFYTVFGNLDNMIWLGSVLKSRYLWLILLSISTVPLFILVAAFLSTQCERHRWIPIVGSGMMAWAAGALIVQGKLFMFPNVSDSHMTQQAVLSVLILTLGFIVSRWTLKFSN